MSLEQKIKDTLIAESVDLDMRLQQLVRAGLMPSNTIPLLRKAISKIQGGYPLQGAERDVMANFLNAMMFIVLGDDAIFNKARVGAKSYAMEETEELDEKRGLWDNIHAKRKRIKAGSGERMRKPGSEGAPSAADLKNSRTEEVEQVTEATYFVHTANKAHHVNKKIPTGKKDAMGQALMTSKVVKSFPYGDTQSKQTSPDQHKAAHAHAKKLNAGVKEEVETIDELSKGKLQSYMDKAKTKPGEVVANVNDSGSMRKYGNRLNGRIRAGRKLLAKESRRTEALADIASVSQMNESYRTTFNAALSQYGIKSPSELDEEKRKEFFNFVDQEYKKGDN